MSDDPASKTDILGVEKAITMIRSDMTLWALRVNKLEERMQALRQDLQTMHQDILRELGRIGGGAAANTPPHAAAKPAPVASAPPPAPAKAAPVAKPAAKPAPAKKRR